MIINSNNTLRGHIKIVDGLDNEWNALINTNALRMACKSLGVELGEFLESFEQKAVEVIPHLLFAGVRNYQLLNREDQIDDFDHFACLVGTMDFVDVVEQIGDALILSSGNVKGVPEAPKTNPKAVKLSGRNSTTKASKAE
tara:strand:- start:910 stop:1332 length:423 start_codon:yes stop_codon:yes gene_type:complete